MQLKNSDVFIDCGAFIGDTIKEVRRRNKSCRIVSFEPSVDSFNRLKRKWGRKWNNGYKCWGLGRKY